MTRFIRESRISISLTFPTSADIAIIQDCPSASVRSERRYPLARWRLGELNMPIVRSVLIARYV
jgi:hypothetical protein